jgi:superfamily II DNA or RNA helicase
MKGVPTHKGEWQVSGAHERMNVLTGNIVNHWQQHANNRKTLAFTVNVAHAEELAAEFELQGIPADFVCGRDTDERRKRVLKAFAAGELKVLTNCEVLTKGYDQPDVEVGIMAKPTRSLSTHIQMCGRMLRVAPGKQIATYFDHAGNFERHGYPDDPLPTTLSTKERGVSEIDSRGKKEPMPWNCPQCFTVVEHGRNCPSCGYIAKSKSEVDVLPGALKKLDPTQNRKQDVFSMLLGHAELNGFKKGWAAHKFEKIFKVGPDGLSWQPKEPAPALKEWIRGQNYSYMKRERIL